MEISYLFANKQRGGPQEYKTHLQFTTYDFNLKYINFS
jgi:hypothetical protein